MNFERLGQMLSYKRPHNGSAEFAFYERFILPYEPEVFLDMKEEPMAYVIKVAASDSPITTLFSCHVDTVHRQDGTQKPVYDASLDMFYKDDGECLGADDSAGCWLLLEMIDAGIPGAYVFHRGEECGGIGSKALSKHHYDFLETFTHAVAFDRKADCSVITHQGYGGRCCSDAFAKDLAERLSAITGFELKPDSGGVFTDTANYVDLIAECTNISVGYYDEHRAEEMLDCVYLKALREACVDPNTWKDLIVSRKPGEKESRWGRWDANDWKGGWSSKAANQNYKNDWPATGALTTMFDRHDDLEPVGDTTLERDEDDEYFRSFGAYDQQIDIDFMLDDFFEAVDYVDYFMAYRHVDEDAVERIIWVVGTGTFSVLVDDIKHGAISEDDLMRLLDGGWAAVEARYGVVPLDFYAPDTAQDTAS